MICSNPSTLMQYFRPFRCTVTHITSLEPCMPFVGMQKLRLKEMNSIMSQSRKEGGLELLVLCAGPLPHFHIQHSDRSYSELAAIPWNMPPFSSLKTGPGCLGTATPYLSDCRGLACSSPCTYKMQKGREWIRIKVYGFSQTWSPELPSPAGSFFC